MGTWFFCEIWHAVRFHAYDISIALSNSVQHYLYMHEFTMGSWSGCLRLTGIFFLLRSFFFSFPYFFFCLVTRFTSIFESFRLSLLSLLRRNLFDLSMSRYLLVGKYFSPTLDVDWPIKDGKVFHINVYDGRSALYFPSLHIFCGKRNPICPSYLRF